MATKKSQKAWWLLMYSSTADLRLWNPLFSSTIHVGNNQLHIFPSKMSTFTATHYHKFNMMWCNQNSKPNWVNFALPSHKYVSNSCNYLQSIYSLAHFTKKLLVPIEFKFSKNKKETESNIKRESDR